MILLKIYKLIAPVKREVIRILVMRIMLLSEGLGWIIFHFTVLIAV
ncbi:hypothetical protein C621_0228405 [Bacillus thuringiensis serovar aizawai str. Leapi01]|nr:hypothetical protein C621_0228405 [Bacillus thuringiensis serovar aizawai str. Leapi01]